MSYDFLVREFLSKSINISDVFDLNLRYFSSGIDSKKVKKVIVNNTSFDIQKLGDILDNYAKQNKYLLAFPSAQNFISNKATIIGEVKKVEGRNDELELSFEVIDNITDLKYKLWKKLEKKVAKGICIVCGKETNIIPINSLVSASTLKNPFNFEFGRYERFSYGLCNEHIDRVLWFYLLDIWNKATLYHKVGGYYVKILLYLENLDERRLLDINKRLYNTSFTLKNIISLLNEIKEKLQIKEYQGNLFVIIYKIIGGNKAAVFRIYTIYNIEDWLKYVKDLLNKININLLIGFINKNSNFSDKAQLEIFDVVFQRKDFNKLLLVKRGLYEYFRERYFRRGLKYLSDAIEIVRMVVSKNYELLENAGYIVGLVDRWYFIKGYNTRVGQIVFSKRNPSIKDIKLAVAEALRRAGLRDDLKAFILSKIEDINKIREVLKEFVNDNLREIDLSLAFSTGYFRALKGEEKEK